MSTVTRTKRRFVEGNPELALSEAPRSGAARELTGREEALLVATACSKPTIGRAAGPFSCCAANWSGTPTTRASRVQRETVRRRLSEKDLKPWRKDMWCIPKVDAAYVAAIEDVLDLSNEVPDPNHPVVCLDESPVQLIGETRTPVPGRPGQPRRFDYEYRRNGTANLFVFLDAHQGGARSRSPNAAQLQISPPACGISVTYTFPKPTGSGLCSTTSQPTRRPHSTPLCRPRTHGASCAGSSFITHRNTPAGSTWSRMPISALCRDLDRGLATPASQPPHPGPGYARSRDRGTGEAEERKPGTHQLDVHDRKGPGQDGESLPQTRCSQTISQRVHPKSRRE